MCLQVRDPRAGYMQSLSVLRAAKATGVYTKSSIMLGLGETDEEIIDTMLDLKVRCVVILGAPEIYVACNTCLRPPKHTHTCTQAHSSPLLPFPPSCFTPQPTPSPFTCPPSYSLSAPHCCLPLSTISPISILLLLHLYLGAHRTAVSTSSRWDSTCSRRRSTCQWLRWCTPTALSTGAGSGRRRLASGESCWLASMCSTVH